MKQFIFYDRVYDEKDISCLRNLCDEIKWERIKDFYIKSDEIVDADGNRYVSFLKNYLNPDRMIQAYLDYIPEYAAGCLTDGFKTSGGYTPDIKLSKYEKNDHYGWHCDCWAVRKNANWRRQLSSITYLNNDYEGGETEFEGEIIIKPEVGKTVIFPSAWLFPHQGRPVLEGTKYIYVKHIWV